MSVDRQPLTRRRLLQALGVAGAGVALVGCGGEAGDDGVASPTGGTGTSPAPVDGAEAARAAVEAAGLTDATIDYTVIVASFEILAGESRRVAFALRNVDNEPELGTDVRAYVVRAEDLEVVQGPVTPVFHGEGLGPLGVYVFESDIPEPGIHDLVVATADGAHAGTAAMRVIDVSDSLVIQPGAAFPSVDTPTVGDEQGVAELCTRDPDCTMHDLSLETALAEGKPIVLTIATPKFCSSRVCGPVVDVVEELHTSMGRDDVAWIHVEVFEDAGNTPVELVTELKLPSEPWTFLIGADGAVVDRYDGPVVPELLRGAIDEL